MNDVYIEPGRSSGAGCARDVSDNVPGHCLRVPNNDPVFHAFKMAIFDRVAAAIKIKSGIRPYRRKSGLSSQVSGCTRETVNASRLRALTNLDTGCAGPLICATSSEAVKTCTWSLRTCTRVVA